MPTWDDRAQLPYLQALIKELHRWGTPAVLAFYHATSEPDEYRGNTVPANTTVIYNTYGIHHSDTYYQQHEKSMPERFLDEQHHQYMPQYAHGPVQYGFGVGRRECPGKHVAESSLFILISRMLWAFDFRGPTPGNGTGESLTLSHISKLYKPLLTSRQAGLVPILGPAQFECTLTPRDEKTASYIVESAKIHDPSLQAEDTAQYEARVAEVLSKQGGMTA